MSRASVASVTARAGAWRNLALRRPPALRRRDDVGGSSSSPFDGSAPLRATPSFRGEQLLQRAVPIAILLFVAILAAISWHITYQDEERVVAGAAANIELLSSVVADDLDRHLGEQPTPALDGVGRLISPEAQRRGLRVIVGNEAGDVIASVPPSAAKTSLSDELGASPLTIFAEKAGVMRLTLPRGGEALAAVRSLPALGGQIAVVQTMEGVLAELREGRSRSFVLMVSVGAVLAALAFGYAWQAGRARDSDTSCRAMRERVDMVLARGRCGLWDWDLASGHIDWSLSMFEIIGLLPRKKALSFAEVNALIHPDDGGLNELTRLLTLNRGGAVDHVFRMKGPSGEWIWLRAKAEIIDGNGGSPHLVGIAIDITETMALEERSAAADMRLRDAIETISEAFVVWDADNRLVMCNSKFQRFHNLPTDAVASGTPYAQVMERGTAPLIHSQVAVVERQPMGARTFEAQLGDGRWLQINERRTKDGGYVSVGTDITALKRHEEQLMDSEAQLLGSVADLKKSRQLLTSQAREMTTLVEKYREQKADAETANRAKSDFLANMSHELRTPLNAILGFSEVMMTEAFGPIGSPLYGDYSKHIHQSGHSLNQMITDVLEMAHLDSGRVRLDRTDFPVADAMEAAVLSVSQAAIAAQITIETEPYAATAIHADRNAMTKILAILLNNGVKYTPAGGTVTVRSRIAQGMLALSVEDTGVGIPPEALSRLGNPFEQADLRLSNGMRGSGLGLAIARSLVELHGGVMRISSKPDVGTTVLVQLPGEVLVRAPLQVATRMTGRPPRLAAPAYGEKRPISAGG